MKQSLSNDPQASNAKKIEANDDFTAKIGHMMLLSGSKHKKTRSLSACKIKSP